MQETSVGWDPAYIDRAQPLPEKLFVLYCLVVLLVAIGRSANLARQLWFTGELSKHKEKSEIKFDYVWNLCKAKVAGMRKLVGLTGLLTLLVFALGTTNILIGISTEKSVGIAALAGAASELSVLVTIGVFVCSVLYAFGAFYEGVLARRQAAFRLACANRQLRSER